MLQSQSIPLPQRALYDISWQQAQQDQRRWHFMMSWLHTCTVSLLYTDTRYNDKIRFSDNWNVIKPPLKSNLESARLCKVFLLYVKNFCTLSYLLTKQRMINDKVKSVFFFFFFFVCFFFQEIGHRCSKLTMLFINVSLNLWSANMEYTLIFLLKKCE